MGGLVVGAEQAGFMQIGHARIAMPHHARCVGLFGFVDVGGEHLHAHAARTRPLLADVVDAAAVVAARCQAELQQRRAVGEQLFLQPFGGLPVRLVGHGDALAIGLGQRDGVARLVRGRHAELEREPAGDARVAQALRGGHGAVFGGLAVRVVEHGGHAGVDGLQAADQFCEVVVLGRHRDDRAHLPLLVVRRVLGRTRLDQAAHVDDFPDVAVAVDQARHEDHAFRIDDFGIGRRLQVRADGGNAVAVDQQVTAVQVSQLGVSRQDAGVLDQGVRHVSLGVSKGPRMLTISFRSINGVQRKK
ncbi:hypothetical protein D9M72_437270 [compost metagenome]